MPQKVQEIKKKPNILVIWGDDIGINNLSCYSHGVRPEPSLPITSH
jgi:arylsulfatase A-like enzyme